MARFNFIKTHIDGVYIIEPTVFGDNRGFFMETYNYEEFKKGGIDAVFVQDNHSKSVKGVLRGLHAQKKFPQSKLVRVISGEVFDVAVDMRRGSKTYGKWVGVNLSAENKRQLFIPKGFLHGFYVISDEAEFCYKCDEFYHPEDECAIIWNDSDIGIEWPIEQGSLPMLSEKDNNHPALKEGELYFD